MRWTSNASYVFTNLILILCLVTACKGGDDGTNGPTHDPGPGHDPGEWPTENAYSWDGRWTPADEDFPLEGMFDDEYGDGHDGSPILPPGAWDWEDENDDLANWRNFNDSIGGLEQLLDDQGRIYGWKLAANDADSADWSGPAAYFEGSAGADVIDLGPNGHTGSFGQGNLRDGPDVFIFNTSNTLDFRTGSNDGPFRDDDLIIAGCDVNGNDSYDITTTTVHTGPGHDWLFVRDIDRSAIDLGNGENGRTDSTDPSDGDDLVTLRGNTHDFRVFGGNGNDTVVWYVDENVQEAKWLGPNFFGGGGHEAALWEDEGTDRLVLAVPPETPIVDATPTPPGAIFVGIARTEDVWIDKPTVHDPFAVYCIECGRGPGDRYTMIFEYMKADEQVFTGHFYVTAFEEFQIGVGEGARVYRIDDTEGALVEDATLEPLLPAVPDASFCE